MVKELKESMHKSKRREKWRKLFVNSANSLVLYLLAFLIVYLIYNLLTVLRARDFGIKYEMFYWKIVWQTIIDNRYTVVNIFCLGPFACFFIAAFIAALYMLRRRKNDLISLFWLWIVLHCLNMFLGSVIVGILTTVKYNYYNQFWEFIGNYLLFTREDAYCSNGMGYVFDYLFLKRSEKLILFILAIAVSVVIGYFSAIFFLKSSSSASLLDKKKYRRLLIIFQAIIPWAVGTLFLLIIKYPHNTRYEVYFYLTMLLFVIPPLINVNRNPPEFKKIVISRHQKAVRLLIINSILVLGLYIAFRILLSDGNFIPNFLMKIF